MKAPRQALLDDLAFQKEYLKVLRKTGRFDLAHESIGLTAQGVQKYRDKHPQFNEACLLAKSRHDVQKYCRARLQIYLDVQREIERRISEGTISDMALLKIRDEIL